MEGAVGEAIDCQQIRIVLLAPALKLLYRGLINFSGCLGGNTQTQRERLLVIAELSLDLEYMRIEIVQHIRPAFTGVDIAAICQRGHVFSSSCVRHACMVG